MSAMRVGIVGAGISGVVAGAHLKAAGLDITVFERSSQAGGVWLYDERLPPEPEYPSLEPSEADFPESEKNVPHDEHHQQLRLTGYDDIKHAPPGSSAHTLGLKNNVSTRMMKLRLNSWPNGTEDFVNHRILNEYIQDTSRRTGVHSRTQYDTRVENVSKDGEVWKVQTSTLVKDQDDFFRIERDWTFEAVVIASGHYHACRIPDVPGLAAWKKQWPDRVQHSKSYRHPGGFKGQTALLIGAGVSSIDIAREIAAEGVKIIQLSRNGAFDLPASLLPPEATRVLGEVAAFETFSEGDMTLTNALEPIPGRVVLKDGRELSDIHRIIFCTGYHLSLPFLRQYHEDKTPVHQAGDTVLVTDGTQFHNLHKDIWYIPDPSLIFIGVPYFTATFTLFEFQAIVVAAVLSGKAFLPSKEKMRTEYEERVRKKGTGKMFHSLRDREVEYVDELLEWVNGDGEKMGAVPLKGHTAQWHEANVERLERVKKLFGDRAWG